MATNALKRWKKSELDLVHTKFLELRAESPRSLDETLIYEAQKVLPKARWKSRAEIAEANYSTIRRIVNGGGTTTIVKSTAKVSAEDKAVAEALRPIIAEEIKKAFQSLKISV